jgi:hypothetical protein
VVDSEEVCDRCPDLFYNDSLSKRSSLLVGREPKNIRGEAIVSIEGN